LSLFYRSVQKRGGLFILAAALLWSSLGVAGRFAFRAGVVPLEAAFYRAAISVAILLVFLVATNRRALRIHPRDLGLFAAFGLIGVAAFFVVYMTAINTTTVATAAILLYTAPAFVLVLSALLFGETLTTPKAIAVACAFTGCVLVGRGYDPSSLRLNLPGVLAGLASGLAYALYTIFGKAALRRYAPLTVLTYALGFGTIFLGTVALVTAVIPRAHPSSGWMALGYLALVTTLLAQVLYLTGLRYIDAGPASLLATVEPVTAAMLGYIVFGERLEGLQIAGSALVVGAVMLARGLAGPRNGS
jgi:drug/metabolite transporter, DME family